jgi:hypothetical protein
MTDGRSAIPVRTNLLIRALKAWQCAGSVSILRAKEEISMARKVGQIISRGDRRWLIRVYLGRDHETNKRKYHNRTIHGPMRDAQAYLTRKLRERDLGRDLEGAKITINEYLDRWLETAVKARVREKTYQDTKRARSRRVVKLQNWIVALLREQFTTTTANTSCPEAADLLFKTPSGQPINADYLAKQFKSLLRLAGLPIIRLYDLRHTAATVALMAGVPTKVVSEQLGHASAAFTLDTYAHVLPHMQDEAAAKCETLLLAHQGLSAD